MDRPKYAILTYSTVGRDVIFGPTNWTKELWAYKNQIDYRFALYEPWALRPQIRHPMWEKPYMILRHIKNYDAVLYMDDDAGIVKQDVLKDFVFGPNQEHDVYWTEDEEGINAGVGLFWNRPKTMEFLNWWCDQSLRPDFQHGNRDQLAVVEYHRDHPGFFGCLPGDQYNAHQKSFVTQKKCPNLFNEDCTFIVHVAGGSGRKDELLTTGEYKKIFEVDSGLIGD